jgi:heme/copper-type cytochrome/quinol oxidase subunit 3
MTLALIAAGLVMMLAAHQSGQENSWRPMAYWGAVTGWCLLGAWLEQ